MTAPSPLADASAWIGAWPFAEGLTTSLPALLHTLQRAGITGGAAISPLAAVLAATPMPANQALTAAIARQQSPRFPLWSVPVLNPTLPGWEADLAVCLEEGGNHIGGFRLLPNYHGYAADGPAALACAEAIAAAGKAIVVQIRMLDERAHHPLMKVPATDIGAVTRLAAAIPVGRFLAAGLFFGELPALAEAPNLAIELSSIETGDTLPMTLQIVPPERIMLGTHAPIYYPAPAVAKLVGVSDAIKRRIGSDNMRQLFGDGTAAST